MTPVLLAIVFAAAVLYKGPLSFGPLTELLERELDAAVPQLGVRIDAAVLNWNREIGRLEVQVVNARLLDRKGASLAAFPLVSLDFNGEDLLLGRLVPEGVELWKPRIHLFRGQDGGFYLEAQGQSRRWPLTLLFAGLANTAAAAGSTILQPGKTRTIRLIAHQADLSVEDLALGIKASASAADVKADYHAGETSLSFASLMTVGGEEISVGLGVIRRQDGKGYETSVRFEGARASALHRILPIEQLKHLAGAEVDLAGSADFFLGDNGALSDLDLDVAIGPGKISLPEYFPAPLDLKAGILRCRFDDNFKRLLLSNVDAEFADGLHLFFAGEVSGLSSQLSVIGAGGLENLDAKRIKHYWPLGLAGGARAWVTKNILGGRISDGEVSLDIKPGDLAKKRLRDKAVEFTWNFDGIRAHYMENMPDLKQGRGSGLVTGRRFELMVKKALSEGLVASQGHLLVPDFSKNTNDLHVDFVAEGTVANVFALIDREPLKLVSDMGMAPASAQGNAWVKTSLRFPLKDDLELADIKIDSSAQLQGFSSDQKFGGYRLSEGILSVKADNSQIKVFGTSRINGVPGEMGWSRYFQAEGPAEADRLKIKMRIDDAGRRALGFDFGDLLRGPVWAEGDFHLGRQGVVAGNVRANLSAATISIEDIDWEKRADTAGNLEVDLKRRLDGSTGITRLAVRAGDLEFLGNGEFDTDNKLLHLNGERLAFAQNDLAFKLSWLADGTKKLDFSGRRLDLRSYFDESVAIAEPEHPAQEPFDLTMQIDQVVVTDDIGLTDVRATASRRNGIWSRVNSRALINAGPGVRMFVKPAGEARKLMLFAQDAGAVARALGIAKGVSGGKLRLDAVLPLGRGWRNGVSGTLRAANFKVVNAPVLAQMLSLGSLTGIADALGGEGIAFTRFEAPFLLKGPRLAVKRARAVGPALGLTANIEFDRASKQVKAKGTIVPAYSISAVMGNIPIIGDILVGKPGEGLFAMNYSARGNWEKPKIIVNPLSALAPAFLRNIVSGIEEPVAPEPVN